jgi:hypothetical protein
MRVLSAFTKPSFFYINIEFQIRCEVPADLLDSIYREHLQILYSQLRVRLHLVQINKDSVKLICSSDEEVDNIRQKDISKCIEEISQKTLSVFEPEIKTPIGIQWEFI